MFSCSCFIDQSIWFVNSIAHSWKFDSFACVNGVVSDELFIYKKKFTFVSSNDSVQYINEIVICYLKCFEFMLTYFISDKMCYIFNEHDCLYVIDEPFCYNSEIYIGNEQFMTSNEILSNEQRKELYQKRKIKLKKIFKKEPERKSCFTSMDKYSYEFFCSNCKIIFDNFFLEKLYFIRR